MVLPRNFVVIDKEMIMDIKELLEQQLPYINERVADLYFRWSGDRQRVIESKIVVSYGQKFARLIVAEKDRHTGEFSERSSFGFVVLVDGKFPAGTILKAASWKAPALNFARGYIHSREGIDKAISSWTGVS
jgi:hypothetical protein